MFPWKWIKRIYLEDNPILVNFDNWIYFQIFRKSCTRSSFWEVSSPWRYICCREKERNVSIQWIFFLKFVSEFDFITSYLLWYLPEVALFAFQGFFNTRVFCSFWVFLTKKDFFFYYYNEAHCLAFTRPSNKHTFRSMEMALSVTFLWGLGLKIPE